MRLAPALVAVLFALPLAAAPRAPGDVLASWPTGLPAAWGIAVDRDTGNLWVGSPSQSWGGDARIHEFQPDGTSTGLSHPFPWLPLNGPADAAWDPTRGSIWILATETGVDTCIHEIDPASGATGTTICPTFPASQRGLAYDPTTDQFFAGNWIDQVIYRFDATGAILQQVNVGIEIAGLAYNPTTHHLFVMTNAAPNPVHVLDAQNGFVTVGQFGVAAGFGDFSGAGLDIDCGGRLWAVDQFTETAYQIDSGESAPGLCPCGSIAITPATLPDGRVGVAYAQQLTAIGGIGPYTYATTAGTLPPGMTVSGNGLLGGTPSAAGTFAFDVTAYDWNGCTDSSAVRQAFTLRVIGAVDYLAGEGLGQPNGNLVRVYRADSTPTPTSFTAYAAGQWGTNVAAGPIDGDAYAEILTGPGPGAVFGPQVRGFKRDGTAMGKVSFYAYGTLRYGVNPDAGAIDADAFDEILTGPGPGAVFGPHVRAFNFDGATLAAIAKVNFFAYGTLKYGVNVADGDVDGDSFDEILTGPGPGAIFGPQVRAFNFDGAALANIAKINFNAYTGIYYGVNVAAGDVEADTFGEIVSVQGPGTTYVADYRIWNYDGAAVSAIPFTYAPFSTFYGGRAAAGDLTADGAADLAAAPGPDPSAAARVDGWDVALNSAIGTFSPFTSFYGANVAVGTLGF